jgi:hypothetical protein
MCYLTERNAVKFVKKVFGKKDVEGILQRLDRLTHDSDEARRTAAQTLEVVYDLVKNISVVMDGELMTWLDTRRVLNIFPSRWQGIH